MPKLTAAIVPVVVVQHVEESAALQSMRTRAVGSPQFDLRVLRRLDSRLGAHVDGLAIAGDAGWPYCEQALERATPGTVFTATVRAVEDRRGDRLDRLFALTDARPEGRPGLHAAFGWLEPDRLRGVVAKLLTSEQPLEKLVGIAACSMHRVDPGLMYRRWLEDPDATVRARACRIAGELGKNELVSEAAAAAIAADDFACQFWAAWSAVLLGDKQNALELLNRTSGSPGPFQARAFQLAIQAMSLEDAHQLLQRLAQAPGKIRRLIRGAGLAGDPTYVPWMIEFMIDDKLGRIAGEAFSLVTGMDLAPLGLERKPPENFESGPNDDPNDPNVEMDEDDGLPWPDQKLIQAWWNSNSHRFQPGVRYFMGEPLNRENCLRVLKEGYQRQRILAAHYLCLLNPGTVLFNTSAPAWRQQRLLAQMS